MTDSSSSLSDYLLLDFSDIDKREFGFLYSGDFKRKMQFLNKETLIKFINMIKPKDCFVSNARYETPCSISGFIGCDFFLDIDTEDGIIENAYSDALLTLKILEKDFGFKNIVMNKSGFKGYHLIVSDECVQDLTPNERDEMVQYFQMKYKIKSIDAPCTCDIHRLRRIEGTVNSKSGLLCKRLITKREING